MFHHNSLRTCLASLAAASLAALGLAACGSVPTESALLEGSATAVALVSEDEGAVGEGAVATETDEAPAFGVDEAAGDEVDRDAAGEAQAHDACDFRARRARIRAQYDANGDGQLDATERAALRADIGERVDHRLPDGFAGRVARRVRHVAFRRVLWAFDENNDGRLSMEERTAMVDALENRCRILRARVLSRFDSSGDGTLQPAELAAARQAFRERLAARKAAVLARYDANGDGTLDREEREAFKRDLIARARARRAELMAQFDVSGDGTLQPAELAALKAYVRARIHGADEPGMPQ